MNKLNKTFFVLSYVIGIVFTDIFYFFYERDANLTFLSLDFAVWIYLTIVTMVLWYKAWRSIQDDYTSLTPVRAIVFLLIPIFNLYWIFRAFGGFPKDYNAYIKRHNLSVIPLSEKLYEIYCFLLLCSTLWVSILIFISILFFIPIPDILIIPIGIVNFLYNLIIIIKTVDAVNSIITAKKY